MNRSLLFVALLFFCGRLVAFDLTTQVHNATCGSTTGSIWVYPGGGTWPYTYLWSTGSTAGSLLNVPPGIYSVTVTDVNNETGTAEVEILSTPSLFATAYPLEIWSCEDPCSGTFYQYGLDVGGTGPYTVIMDPPGPSGYADQYYVSFGALCAGNTYSVTITDQNGCTGEYGPITVNDAVPATISSWSATASCPDGSTGSLTVEYDALDSVYVMGPGGWYQPTTNPFTLTNVPPGEYVLHATLLPDGLPSNVYTNACYVSDTLVVPESTDPCGSLDGVLFADVDGDCVQGVNEPGLPYRVLTVEPGGNLLLTDATGTFASSYFYGDYALDASVDNYESLCTSLPADFTLDAGTPSVSYDLGLSPTFGPDVAIYFWMGGHVPGNNANYYITIQNTGPYTFTDLTLDLNYDPLLSYSSANLSPSLVEAGHLQWTIPSFSAFSYLSITAVLAVPPDPGLLGTVVVGTATVTPTVPDANPSNDSYTAQRTISASFDPNDKIGLTSSRSSNTSYYLDDDNWIDYTIRFQNTGTAPAMNVDVTDTISSLLDMTSFTLLGSSHQFQASLLPGRILRFHFPYIMLPDSGANMAGSQGFISFRLRPSNTITPGTLLTNAADIYFDFNEPVHTNDAVLLVEQSAGLTARDPATLRLHPNPTTDAIWLDLPEGMQHIDVFAADGRLVRSANISSTNMSINMRELPAGVYNVRATDGSGTLRRARFVKR